MGTDSKYFSTVGRVTANKQFLKDCLKTTITDFYSFDSISSTKDPHICRTESGKKLVTHMRNSVCPKKGIYI